MSETKQAGHGAVAGPVEPTVRRLACSVSPEFRVPLRELVALKLDMERWTERMKVPPCAECGAETPEQAETMCHCSGDKDDCHGVRLWPDA